MTTEIKRLTKKLVTANKRLERAHQDKDVITAQLRRATEAEGARLQDLPTIPVKDLGELVADAARSHGAECATRHEAFTSESWKLFRVRLAALVKRAT